MTLTSAQIETIMNEVCLDIPATLKTKEALAFRKKIEKNVEDIVAAGGLPDWSPEYPSPAHFARGRADTRHEAARVARLAAKKAAGI